MKNVIMHSIIEILLILLTQLISIESKYCEKMAESQLNTSSSNDFLTNWKLGNTPEIIQSEVISIKYKLARNSEIEIIIEQQQLDTDSNQSIYVIYMKNMPYICKNSDEMIVGKSNYHKLIWRQEIYCVSGFPAILVNLQAKIIDNQEIATRLQIKVNLQVVFPLNELDSNLIQEQEGFQIIRGVKIHLHCYQNIYHSFEQKLAKTSTKRNDFDRDLVSLIIQKNQINQINQSNQVNEINQSNQMNELNGIQYVNQMNQMNESNALKRYVKPQMRILSPCTVGCDKCPGPNKDCLTCKSGYTLSFNNWQIYCNKCDASCKECSGVNSNQCTKCQNGLKLQSDKTCLACSSGTFYNPKTSNCETCSDNCSQCTSNASCTVCNNGFALNKSKVCLACNATCTACQINNGYYYDDALNCLQCDISCQTCQVTATNCMICKSNLKAMADGSCVACNQDGYFIQGNNCVKCDPSCFNCNGTQSNNCTSCNSPSVLYTDTSECKPSCETESGYFLSNTSCTPCDQTCATCSAGADTDCILCSSDLYQYANDKRCRTCPNTTTTVQSQYCTQTGSTCKVSSQNSSVYSLQTVCTQCQSGKILLPSQNTCVNACTDLNINFVYNTNTQSCQCSSSLPYEHVSTDGTITCYASQQSGYICGSAINNNNNMLCKQCISNCSVCVDLSTCQTCNSNSYLWNGLCPQQCNSTLGLIPNTTLRSCTCQTGYFFRTQNNLCVLQLKVVSIELAKNSQYNIITATFNRVPYPDEMSNTNLKIDPSTLIENTDYNVISQTASANKIIFDVAVQQNRKINEIVINYNSKSQKFTVKNTILTTEKMNEEQFSMQENMKSISSTSSMLSPQDGAAKNLISILKSFQFLCLLSNFVQLLGGLIIFKESLPYPIYIGSILGASFIFEKIPDSEQVSAQAEGDVVQASQNEQMLEGLGLTCNIYNNFILSQLALLISVVLVLLCLLARWLMRGKQYTITVVNVLINTMADLQQGYITGTVFSIYYSMRYTHCRYIAIFQLIIHIVFIVLITTVAFQRNDNQIMDNFPNFIQNLNTKAKGWRSYMIMSYAKKYVSVFVILLLYENAKSAGIILTILFFANAIYLLYYRFFNHLLFNGYKILQELLISATMLLFSVCVSKQSDLLQQDIISDEDLTLVNSLSMITLFMFAACLIVSFILFIIRTIIQVFTIIKELRKYLQKRSNINKELFLNSIDKDVEQVFELMKSPKIMFHSKDLITKNKFLLTQQSTLKQINKQRKLTNEDDYEG